MSDQTQQVINYDVPVTADEVVQVLQKAQPALLETIILQIKNFKLMQENAQLKNEAASTQQKEQDNGELDKAE